MRGSRQTQTQTLKLTLTSQLSRGQQEERKIDERVCMCVSGSRPMQIPYPSKNPFTWLFFFVSCPNYTYEVCFQGYTHTHTIYLVLLLILCVLVVVGFMDQFHSDDAVCSRFTHFCSHTFVPTLSHMHVNLSTVNNHVISLISFCSRCVHIDRVCADDHLGSRKTQNLRPGV